jgi:hypothetical protein
MFLGPQHKEHSEMTVKAPLENMRKLGYKSPLMNLVLQYISNVFSFNSRICDSRLCNLVHFHFTKSRGTPSFHKRGYENSYPPKVMGSIPDVIEFFS